MANNLKQFSYEYSIEEITHIYGDKKETLVADMVSNIAVDHDYINKIAPAVYVQMLVTPIQFNNIIKHSKSGKIYLHIKVFDTNGNNPIKSDYVKEQFSYFVSTDDLDYDMDTNKTTKTNDKPNTPIGLGLIKTDLIDMNKILINEIYKDTNSTSIIHQYTKDMDMIIEPFDNNPDHSLMIIPPIEGVHNLLKYLNNCACFYNTGYIFYLDFTKTYLLSTRGKAIDIKDGSYDTIKLQVTQSSKLSSDSTGLIIDKDNKIYIMDVPIESYSLSINKTTEKKFNKLLAIGTSGKNKTASIKINNEKGSSDKVKILRVYNDNVNYITSLKNEIESTSSIVSITRADVNCSIITPYKEYQLVNIKDRKDFDGKYLLISKKEIFVKDGSNFRCNVIMNFKKVS